MVKKYIPRQGDIVYLDFAPTKGHEQTGYRSAVVVSNNVFNDNTKMAFVCPITSNDKEFPTHYLLEDTRSIDYEIRNIKFVERLSDNDFISVITLLNACIAE